MINYIPKQLSIFFYNMYLIKIKGNIKIRIDIYNFSHIMFSARILADHALLAKHVFLVKEETQINEALRDLRRRVSFFPSRLLVLDSVCNSSALAPSLPEGPKGASTTDRLRGLWGMIFFFPWVFSSLPPSRNFDIGTC